jgi:hypothetical protein
MKKTAILLFFIFSQSIGLFAQSVTISPNGTSSIIEANSTNKGFLPPRMSITQRSNLTATDGLMIYCTDCTPAGHYAFSSNTWKPMFDYLTASGPCVQYTVGQQAQGGTVIWVDDSGQHGLVAAPVDVVKSQPNYPFPNYDRYDFNWSNTTINNTTFLVAQRGGIYGGQVNTEKIINALGWGEYAAFLCSQEAWNGYGDWYLPSLSEMVLVYNNRNFLPTPLKAIGLANYEYYYWTSTEAGAASAYTIHIGPGTGSNSVPNGAYAAISKNTGQFSPVPGGAGGFVHSRAVRRF